MKIYVGIIEMINDMPANDYFFTASNNDYLSLIDTIINKRIKQMENSRFGDNMYFIKFKSDNKESLEKQIEEYFIN